MTPTLTIPDPMPRSIRPLVLSLILVVAACSSSDTPTSTTNPMTANTVTYPAKAVDYSPVTWGFVGGVDIVGGFGSGASADPNDPTIVYIMTDRGANTATGLANTLFFPLPAFNPVIAKYRIIGDSLKRLGFIVLRNAAGVPLTGIPNPPGAGATGEIAIGIGGATIAPDPEGVDPEGLAVAADGSFWVSDEYGPHIIHFDVMGKTIERVNPFGTGTGGRKIPRVLSLRRANRGMEGLAFTTDGKTLLGGMQSPLDNPTPAIGRTSNANRLVAFDLASGTSKQFVYEVNAVGNFISDITAITNTTFLVDERDGNFQGGSPAAVTKRIYKIDISGATDVNDAADGANGKQFNGKALEAMTSAERTAAGITSVTKTLVYDLLTLPGGYPHDKFEGLVIMNPTTIAVTNDDDFGVVDNGAGGMMFKSLPATGKRDALAMFFIKLAASLK